MLDEPQIVVGRNDVVELLKRLGRPRSDGLHIEVGHSVVDNSGRPCRLRDSKRVKIARSWLVWFMVSVALSSTVSYKTEEVQPFFHSSQESVVGHARACPFP